MMTGAKHKIFKELRKIHELINSLNCSCSETEIILEEQQEVTNNSLNLLFAMHLLQMTIMFGLIIALMCNFFTISQEPKWKDVAWKALVFGAIVFTWPIYGLVFLIMSCYVKCFEDQKVDLDKPILTHATHGQHHTVGKARNGLGPTSSRRPKNRLRSIFMRSRSYR